MVHYKKIKKDPSLYMNCIYSLKFTAFMVYFDAKGSSKKSSTKNFLDSNLTEKKV